MHGEVAQLVDPPEEVGGWIYFVAMSRKAKSCENEEPRSKLRGITELKQSDLSQIFAGLPLPLHVPFDSLPVGPLSHRRDIVPIAPKFSAP